MTDPAPVWDAATQDEEADAHPWLIPLEQVAADLAVSMDTARVMARTGEIPAIKVRSVWRVPVAEYERWKVDQTKAAARRRRYAQGL